LEFRRVRFLSVTATEAEPPDVPAQTEPGQSPRPSHTPTLPQQPRPTAPTPEHPQPLRQPIQDTNQTQHYRDSAPEITNANNPPPQQKQPRPRPKPRLKPPTPTPRQPT